MNTPSLTLHLFGPMRILVHGGAMPRVRTRSVEWLLALLALRHGRTVNRSWLAGTLWPESEESRALHNLRDDLMRLRKALGSEAGRIQSPSRDTLTLDLTGTQIDVLKFDSAIRAGDEASLRDAVETYTGPLLEGCLEEWVFLEREGREQACLEALETLADAAEQRGAYPDALALLRRAQMMDSLRDSTQRGLMRILAASGEAPTALLTYREHRLRLHREMNIEPDTETTCLFREIRARVRETVASHPTLKKEGGRMQEEMACIHPVSSIFAPSFSLPHPITALIGREQDVREIAERVVASRLVTLVGGGGVGKTRLAVQVAAEISRDFADETVFVALASLSDPARLPTFLAKVLGVREVAMPESECFLQALIGWLNAHPLLLVVDNCEHLIEAVATLAQTLLERCPGLRILATSRQRLGLTGEVAWRVPSLPSPDPQTILDSTDSNPKTESPVEFVLQYPAVQLFVERAAMVRTGFQLTGREDAEAVAQICCRLDGIPLAIELAAARMGMLTVGQIAARLDDRFRLLTGGSRTALNRHQTLRALIDWSYDLLVEPERVLLHRLSVFVDGWTLEAAEQVTGNGQGCVYSLFSVPSENVLDLLASLSDKSLVLAEECQADLRYRMLETVREYALEKLRESGEEEAARNRHLAYCLHLVEEAGPALSGSDPEAVLALVESEFGNLRAALAWVQTPTAPSDALLRLTAALWPFWEIRGYLTEGREYLQAALNRPDLPDSPERAQALLGAATLAFVHDDLEEVLVFGRESLERFRALGNPRGMAAALLCLGSASLANDDVVAARDLLAEGLECCRQCDWKQGSALAFVHLGAVAARERNTLLAQSQLEQGLTLAEAAGDAPTCALSLYRLGCLALETGDYIHAGPPLKKSLEIRRRLGHKHATCQTLYHLGLLAQHQKDLALALSYLEEAIAVYREQGNRIHLAVTLHQVGNILYHRGAYERARPMYVESLDLFRQIDRAWGIGFACNSLGSTLFHLGEPPASMQALHKEALVIYWSGANREDIAWSREGIAWSLERLGVVEARYGDAQRAARLLGAASVAREGLGIPLSHGDQADWDQAVAAVHATLRETMFASFWAEGRTLSLEQAVGGVLEDSLICDS